MMCHSFLCAFWLHHTPSDQCVSILMKSHLAGDLVLNNYKVTIVLQFFIFSSQGASAFNKMSGKQWPKIKVNSMLVTWCIFYRSNLAGTYGTFYQSYEISDLDFLYFFHLERLDFIALIKCTICFSKVAPVEDAQCDQHGIHLNFGPLFAKQFIERTCSLLLLARKEQLRSIKCLANNGPKLR